MHRVLHPGVKPPAITIYFDKKTKKVNVKNSAASPVANYDEAYEMFNKGNATRATSGTGLNASSSRSHLIFAMLIKSSDKRTGKTTLGKVSLIDLAGSERLAKTGASGDKVRVAEGRPLHYVPLVFRGILLTLSLAPPCTSMTATLTRCAWQKASPLTSRSRVLAR